MRDPLHWLSLRYKLALMFVGVCLLAFGVGGYLVSASARGALEQQIHARLEYQARAYATALDGELRALSSRLEDFASDGYIRGHVADLKADSPDAARLSGELLRHLNANKLPLVEAYEALRVRDGAGRTVIETSAGGAPDAIEVDPADGVLCSALLPGAAEDGLPRVRLSAPLLDLQGTSRLGRLSADLHAGVWIASALRGEMLLPADGEAPVELRLEDPRGQILSVDPQRIAQADASVELLAADSGLQWSGGQSGSDDARQFVRSFPIAANQWRVFVALPADSALAAVAGLQSRFVLVGAVLAALSAALLYVPLRLMTRSLDGLRDAAARIEEGDFSARVEATTEDELGALAHAFNLMAAAVEERSRGTERALGALRAESERLAAVIESMRDGLVVLDPDGAPVLHNRAAEPLLKLMRRQELATSHHRCLDGLSEGASCKACLFDAQALPRSCVIEIEGGVFEVRSTRLAADSGGRSGRVLVSRDVTDRVAQDEREIHQERLAVLGEVAAVMAHELNNPLAAISMFNQMLAGELDRNSPLRENVEVIQRNVDTCKRTIRELLDYANNASPEVHEVDVEAALEDVLAFLRPVRQRSSVEISQDFAAAGALVRGDEVQLRQVFVNLVLNGIQACGGQPGRVTVRTSLEAEHVCIDVSDNGCGIPAEMQGRIFKPFFSTKRRGEGTGLGLSTARRIAEMHGGSLELSASAPGSTSFRVRLRRSARASA